MIKLVFRKLQKNDTLIDKVLLNKTVTKNLSYLSIVQILNMILPMISYPYLIRVLDKEIFGLIVFAQNICSFFMIFINFGFNITATRDVSIYRNDEAKLNEIINSVLLIKTILFLLSYIILYLLIIFIPYFNKYELLFLLSLGIGIYETYTALWYFQGIERMEFISYISIITKSIATILILVYVKSNKNYYLVPLFNAIGGFIASVYSMFIIFKVHKPKLYSIKTLRKYFIESLPFFLSRSLTVFLDRTNILIIGSFLNYTDVAYYDLGQKIASMCKIPLQLINQALFPNVSMTKDIKFVWKVIKHVFFLGLFIYIFVYIFSRNIIIILGGYSMLKAFTIVNILNLTTIIAAFSYFFGTTILVVKGYNNIFNKSILVEVTSYFIILLPLYFLSLIYIETLGILIVFSNLTGAVYRYYYIRKYNLF